MRRTILIICITIAAIASMAAKGACGGATSVPTGSGVVEVPATQEPNAVSTTSPRVPRVPIPFQHSHVDLKNGCYVLGWQIKHPKATPQVNGHMTIGCQKRPKTATIAVFLERREAGGKWANEGGIISHTVPNRIPLGTPYPLTAPCKRTGTWRLQAVVSVSPAASGPVSPVTTGKYVVCPQGG